MSIEQNSPSGSSHQDVDKIPEGSGMGLSVAEAFGFAWEMGYTMAIPLVLLALGGRLLDKWLNTSPVLLLVGIFASIVVSSILLGFKATEIIGRTCPVRKSPEDQKSPTEKDEHGGK